MDPFIGTERVQFLDEHLLRLHGQRFCYRGDAGVNIDTRVETSG